MRNLEEIFSGLPEYVGDTWWQEHFSKKFEGTMKGSYYGVSADALKILAEEMQDGLERASTEASDYISSVDVKSADMNKMFKICSNLTSELCPHIDIVRLYLTYYREFDKWAVSIVGGNSKIGYQGDYTLMCVRKDEVIKDFLASDEFVIASMHRLFECDKQMAECESEVRRW